MADDDAFRRSILDGSLGPTKVFLNEVRGFMSDEDQAAAAPWPST